VTQTVTGKHRRDGRAKRGVSDVIAFTIVFSVIITSVGLVSAVGFSTLNDIQTNERTVNAERAFQSLDENLGEIQRGHAPGRSGEIAVDDGVLSIRSRTESPVGDAAKLRFTVSTSSGNLFGRSFVVGSLRYNVGDQKRRIGLESGAVFTDSRGSAYMIDPPDFNCQSDHAIISIVTLQGIGTTDPSGGNVQVVGRENSSRLLFSRATGPDKDVTINIERSRFQDAGEAWTEGLERQGWTVVGPNSVECSGLKEVYIRETVIDISFIT